MQYYCGALISADTFPISSAAEHSLFTNLDQRSFILAHYSPLLSTFLPLSLCLSLSQLVDVSAINPLIYTAMGKRGEARGAQSLGTFFSSCLHIPPNS